MTNKRLTVFPVDNGDSMLIEHDGVVVLTDLHYRKDAQDDDEKDVYDIGKDIRDACENMHNALTCDIFVLTHPDQDHLLGIEDLFHLGSATNWKSDSELIRIDELWVSPYMQDDECATEKSQCMFDEVARREKLIGTGEGDLDGNRIKILSLDGSDTSGKVGGSNKLEWTLLAPTDDEADIGKDDDGDNLSANNSSLVIRWNAQTEGKDNVFLLGGDAEVVIWERIWQDNKDHPDAISWNVLVAPHHCSRSVMARKNEDDEYEYSNDALDALGQIDGKGFVVSSSKEIKRNDDNPPSWQAKQKYIGILEKSGDDADGRFKCTADKKTEPVVFKFTSNGLARSIAVASVSGISLTSQATEYG